MWSINYEDLDKLHMSIGIGLIVAGFILWISSSWVSTLQINTIIENQKEYLSSTLIIQEQNNEIIVFDKMSKMQLGLFLKIQKYGGHISLMIIGLGLLYFHWGYFPFRSRFKKKI